MNWRMRRLAEVDLRPGLGGVVAEFLGDAQRAVEDEEDGHGPGGAGEERLGQGQRQDGHAYETQPSASQGGLPRG